MIPNPLAWYPVPPKRGALRNATVVATTAAAMTRLVGVVPDGGQLLSGDLDSDAEAGEHPRGSASARSPNEEFESYAESAGCGSPGSSPTARPGGPHRQLADPELRYRRHAVGTHWARTAGDGHCVPGTAGQNKIVPSTVSAGEGTGFTDQRVVPPAVVPPGRLVQHLQTHLPERSW
jgi:hypothetical protein